MFLTNEHLVQARCIFCFNTHSKNAKNAQVLTDRDTNNNNNNSSETTNNTANQINTATTTTTTTTNNNDNDNTTTNKITSVWLHTACGLRHPIQALGQLSTLLISASSETRETWFPSLQTFQFLQEDLQLLRLTIRSGLNLLI